MSEFRNRSVGCYSCGAVSGYSGHYADCPEAPPQASLTLTTDPDAEEA